MFAQGSQTHALSLIRSIYTSLQKQGTENTHPELMETAFRNLFVMLWALGKR